MTDQEQAVFNQLTQFAEYFERDSIINTPIRWVVWSIIRFLIWAVRSIQQTILEVLDLSKIMENESVQETLHIFSSVAYAIGILSLIVYAMRRILNPEASSKAFLENLALGIATTAFSGVIITLLLNTSTQIAKTLYTDNKYTPTVHSIINANTIDVYQLVLNGFDLEKAHTRLTVETSPFFDYAEVVEPLNTEMAWDAADVNDHNSLQEFNERWGDTPSSAPPIFGKVIHLDPHSGDPKLVDIGINLWLGINRYYYRYQMNSFYIVMYLLTTLAVYALSSFKFVKLLYEIFYNQTILPFFAFSDFNNATTLKRVLNNIKNAFMMFVLTPLVLVTYTHIQNYLAGKSYNGFTAIIIQFGLALAVIDGPNIVQEITGYDAGLRSTTQGILGTGLGAYHSLRGGASLIKGAGGFLKSASDKTGLTGKMDNAVQSGKEWAFGEGRAQQTQTQPSNANERSAYIQEALTKKEQFSSTSNPSSKEKSHQAPNKQASGDTQATTATNARDNSAYIREALAKKEQFTSKSREASKEKGHVLPRNAVSEGRQYATGSNDSIQSQPTMRKSTTDNGSKPTYSPQTQTSTKQATHPEREGKNTGGQKLVQSPLHNVKTPSIHDKQAKTNGLETPDTIKGKQ